MYEVSRHSYLRLYFFLLDTHVWCVYAINTASASLGCVGNIITITIAIITIWREYWKKKTKKNLSLYKDDGMNETMVKYARL